MDEDWVRPYPPGSGRWVVIAWEAAALAMLTWATIEHFDLMGLGVRLTACVLAALWVVGAWRILEHGVYVSSQGVRVQGLLRSRTMRWREVAGVRLHQATHRVGPWRIESGLTVLLERHDGAMVNTELWAQGVDFHSRPKLFRAVYQEIRRRHQAAGQK
ncbi:hypothetical protein ACTI_23920 [Actinoplanes sp. OR16]|uniref:PH domain-containing protein n=1 Tax=Actinoplanes sp. OR16 TaxID=946334 RepID=UPI000F6E675C|nr:PH domain-containing protein [Actinoplanes sp. OR16]BBH65707.1 hypothetical protein ACTI_23920 [Actinoplanes sp. OR16]